MRDFIPHASQCVFGVCIASVTVTAIITGHDGGIIYTGLGLLGALGGIHVVANRTNNSNNGRHKDVE